MRGADIGRAGLLLTSASTAEVLEAAGLTAGEVSALATAGIVVALVAAQAAVTAIIERDLSRRQPSQVRGPKLLWRLAALNTADAVACLVVGRR